VLPDEEDALPLNERKQQFSFGYVRMVVAAAGCSVKSHATDYDGVDITIASSADYATYYCPEFELQLKCTGRQDLYRDDRVAWTMKEKPFTKLTNLKRFNPAYLGVLVVPPEPDAWLDQNEDRLVTRSRLYWAKVPQLLGIMKSIGEGGDR
jgi:hypothetical protein